jgi:hypothetical protein
MQSYHVPVFNSQGKRNGELGSALQEQPERLAFSSQKLRRAVIIRSAGVKSKVDFISGLLISSPIKGFLGLPIVCNLPS